MLQPIFFLDLGDPWSYLAAERIMASLPAPPEWEPVLGSGLGSRAVAVQVDQEDLGQRVRALELQPLRWPRSWPSDARLATLAACYAKGGGRAVAFSLALLRQQFAAGRDIADEGTVLLAAAACEMHPAAVLQGIRLRATAQRLERALQRARAAGVQRLPAVVGDGQVFSGPDCVELAAAGLTIGRT